MFVSRQTTRQFINIKTDITTYLVCRVGMNHICDLKQVQNRNTALNIPKQQKNWYADSIKSGALSETAFLAFD